MRISDWSSDVCSSDLQFECGFEIRGADDLEYRAENLFLVTFHVGGDMVEESRADEEALLMPLEREAADVDDELGAPVGACLDPAFDLRPVCGRCDGPVNRLRLRTPQPQDSRSGK